MNDIKPSKEEQANNRWPYSWGRAEWVPLGLLTYWVVGNNLPFHFFNVNYSNAWYLIPLGTMSALAGSGAWLIIIWGAFSTQDIAHRCLNSILAMSLIYAGAFAQPIAIVLIPVTIGNLVIWLALAWWRRWKGWQLTNLHQTPAEKKGIQFSIKDILIWTTATAIILTWIGVLSDFFGDNEFTMPQMSLVFFLIQIGRQLFYCPILLLMAIIAMMDCQWIRRRATMLLAIALLTYFPLLMVEVGWTNLGILLPMFIYTTLVVIGALLAGLIMRWAGYRIEKPLRTVSTSE